MFCREQNQRVGDGVSRIESEDICNAGEYIGMFQIVHEDKREIL